MSKKFIVFILAILLASTTAFFFFPQAPLFSDQLNLAICFVALGAQASATILFLTSLRAFKKELKVAYILLAIGILMFGLTQMQLPLSNVITVDPLKLSWFIVTASLLGSAIMFWAIIKFARLLNIRTGWSSPLIVVPGALVLAFLSTFLPHAPLEGISEKTIDGIFATFIASGSLCLATGITTLHIRSVLGNKYKAAMSWLAVAAFMAAFGCLHETVVKQLPYFNQFEVYFTYGIALWPFLATAILFLLASLSFRQTSQQALQLPENATSLDVITYTAQLASNPLEIDTTLDKMRHITATHISGDKLTKTDETTLIGVYLTIEKYLTTKDPLRKFTKEELRDMLPEKFRHQLSN